MASTLLVKDVVWRISVLLKDNSPQFQGWSEREIIHWLNDAQQAIAKYLPLASSRVDAIRLQPGTRQSIEAIPAANCKPGDGSTPTVPIYGTQFLSPRRNMGADGLTPGRVVRMVERDVLDTTDPDWHTRTSTTVLSAIYDPATPRYFYVTPGVPASPQVWIEMAYGAKPIAIPNTAAPGAEAYRFDGTSTQPITVDDEYAEDLVDYVVARANMKDTKYAEKAAVALHTNRFLASLNAKVAAVTGNNPNLTVLPGVSTG